MGMSTIKILIVMVAVAILGITFVAFTRNPLMASTGTFEGVGYVGVVCHKVIRYDGMVEDFGCSKNTLINVGKNLTTSQLFSEPSAAASNDVVTTIQLGNGSTPSDTDTSHPGNITDCGLEQATGLTWSSTGISDGNVTVQNQWTSTCNNVIVNTTGLESANTHTYFAGNTFVDVTLQADDQLTVTWYVWIT